MIRGGRQIKMYLGLGGAMVWCTCSNGHANCKDPGSNSFMTSSEVFPLKPSADICAVCPDNLA